MNRADPFFILIVILVSVLTITYKSAQIDLSDSRYQRQVNQKLKNQIKRLELKQKEYEINQCEKSQTASDSKPQLSRISRKIASQPSQKTEIYVEPEQQAKQMYTEADQQCRKIVIEPACLDQIEAIVTLFPETKWAGKSLVLLTNIYLQSKKQQQATELIRLVKKEFKKYADVQAQITQLESHQL